MDQQVHHRPEQTQENDILNGIWIIKIENFGLIHHCVYVLRQTLEEQLKR